MLSPNQRNTIYKAVDLQKLNVRDFKIEPTEEWIKVTYKPAGFYFRFQPTEVRTNNGPAIYFYLYYTPSIQGAIFSSTKEAVVANIDSLERALPHFSKWLTLLKQEFEQPDLWTEMEQTPDIMVEDAEIVDDLFTPAEIKLLQGRIVVAENQIIALELPEETKSAIVEVLRDMPAKAKRLTKKELWEVLFGVILRESLRAGLTAEHTSDVIKTRYQLFHSPI